MNERERLIELLQDWGNKENDGVRAESIADYLLEHGVIIPPVKVGDAVYQCDNQGRIYESNVKTIIYDTDRIAFDERAIGETIFLSREEAEETLKGGTK